MKGKAKERTKRWLAFLLSFAMVFTSSGMTVLAEEVAAAVTSEAKADEPAAQAEVVTEAPVPQTQAPTEAPAPQTEAPTEAPKPQTEAPVTEPQTEAPTQATEVPTEATEMPTQVSEVPTEATDVTGTEADATEVSENETATEAVSEKEESKTTEFEKEKTATTFQYKTELFCAEAHLTKEIATDADFIAEQKEAVSSYYIDAVNQASAWAAEFGMEVQDALVFDMHFEQDGTTMKVNGQAEVTLQFTTPVLAGEGVIRVLHFTENGVEDVTAYDQNATVNGTERIVLNTDGFSPFAAVRLAAPAMEIMESESSSNQNVITGTDIYFKQVDEEGAPNITSLRAGEAGYMYVSIGFANDDIHVVNTKVSIDLGETDVRLLDFANGTYNANGVTYTIREENGHKYIDVSDFTVNGTTLTMKFAVDFPNGVSDESDSITAKLLVDGSIRGSADLVCSSEPHWTHSKSVNQSSVVIEKAEDGTYSLMNDMEYELKEFSGYTGMGDLWLGEYTMTDVITLPDNTYIPNGTDAADVLALTNFGDGYQIEAIEKEIVIDGTATTVIGGYKITYTVNNTDTDSQMPEQTYKIKLKKDKIHVTSDFQNGDKVVNTLNTSYKTLTGKEGSIATEAKAETALVNGQDLSFADNSKNGKTAADFKKQEENTDYVIEGDYILYRVFATNNTASPKNITITENLANVTPANALVLATQEEAQKNHPWGGTNAVIANNGGTYTVSDDNQIITWNFNNVAPGVTVEGFVLLKVNTDVTAALKNTITLSSGNVSEEKSATVDQKKRFL